MRASTITEALPPPPPPTPRYPNYLMRRVATAVIGVVALILAVVVIRSLGSGNEDGPTQAAPETTTVTEAPASTTTTTTAVIALPRHNDLTQPPVFPSREPPVRVVSPAEPLTIWTIGDSTAQALGELLQSNFGGSPTIATRTIQKTSTGLTRQDYYDWPAALPGILAEGVPDVAIVSMGDNDAQPLQPLGSDAFVEVGSPEWITEYTRRLTGFVDQLVGAGSRVYLIGQPFMRDPTFNERIVVVDSAYRAVAAANPGVTYVDSRALLGDDAGGYTDTLPGPGGDVQVRDTDGIHVSLEGARWMARVVGRIVAADFAVPAP